MNANFYPELDDSGKQAAQKLIEDFKIHLQKAADDAIGDLYTDIVPWIESDSWTNMRNQLIAALSNYPAAKEYDKSYWVRIRKKIFEEHRNEINNDIILDLLKEIEELKERLNRRIH